MQSSSGKTALTCLLLAALEAQGACPQPFKVGPDFIDPAYHSHYARRPCINLDAWMMDKAQILHEVRQHTCGAFGVVEGVMGLFDGASPFSDEGSTLELARWLQWPVLLIVPCQKAGRSIFAALQGFIEAAGAERICGVILNQVSGKSHTDYLKDALAHMAIPVLGAVPQNDLLQWPERHLGLQTQAERSLPSAHELAKLAQEVLDVSHIISLAKPRAAPSGSASKPPHLAPQKTENYPAPSIQIGLARDAAFHFYYHANLAYLKARGVHLIEFSPLEDPALPAGLDGVIFGGGFPEIFAAHLAENASMRTSIGKALQAGLPCYAECGGLMLLAEELVTRNGARFPMVGAVPGAVQMTDRLNHFGYCFCTPLEASSKNSHLPNDSFLPTQALRGHEFHYSQWLAEAEFANLWQVTKKYRQFTRKEGFQTPNVHASYVHLYFPNASHLFESLFGLETML